MGIKLNNAQINALVEKACDKRKQEIKADKDKLTKILSVPVDKKVEALKKEFNSLSKEMKNHILTVTGVSYNETREERFFRTYRNNNIKTVVSKIKELDINELRNKIILASIEATDLASLCKELNISI